MLCMMGFGLLRRVVFVLLVCVSVMWQRLFGWVRVVLYCLVLWFERFGVLGFSSGFWFGFDEFCFAACVCCYDLFTCNNIVYVL